MEMNHKESFQWLWLSPASSPGLQALLTASGQLHVFSAFPDQDQGAHHALSALSIDSTHLTAWGRCHSPTPLCASGHLCFFSVLCVLQAFTLPITLVLATFCKCILPKTLCFCHFPNTSLSVGNRLSQPASSLLSQKLLSYPNLKVLRGFLMLSEISYSNTAFLKVLFIFFNI